MSYWMTRVATVKIWIRQSTRFSQPPLFCCVDQRTIYMPLMPALKALGSASFNPSKYSGRTVRVRAIYGQGAEQSVLYDSACAISNASIAVEFAEHYKGARRRLDRIVARDKRAWVVVDGTFYGPEAAEVDPKLPDWLKNELQGTPKRYGHLGAFTSMFRILVVVSAAPVAPDVPQ
jgi:hypothetical protein